MSPELERSLSAACAFLLDGQTVVEDCVEDGVVEDGAWHQRAEDGVEDGVEDGAWHHRRQKTVEDDSEDDSEDGAWHQRGKEDGVEDGAWHQRRQEDGARAREDGAREDREDGAWHDFMTEPGEAGAWTTAYVGRCLLYLPVSLRTERFVAALERAAARLRAQASPLDGWGYNHRCPPDADTTAHAILFLHACGLDVPIVAYRRLLSFQCADGGFATYRAATTDSPQAVSDGWMHSHPCVTPVALHALLTVLPLDDPRIARGLEAVRTGQHADLEGLWPSYWWQTPLYGTAVSLEAAVELGLAVDREALVSGLRRQRPDAAFELALLARCWTLLGQVAEADEAVASLLRLQRADGSWPSRPSLRVTRPDCAEPWAHENAGPVFADPRRLFTTATVLRALAEPVQRRGRGRTDNAGA